MSALFQPVKTQVFKDMSLAPGAVVYFYEAGTSTPKAVYSDAGLTTLLGTSATADANGDLPAIYLDNASIAYKYRIEDASGALIDEQDNYRGVGVFGGPSTVGAGSVSELESFALAAGSTVYLSESGRSGTFVVKAGTPPADLQKGLYIVLANGNYAERIQKHPVNVKWFGAKGDGVADDTSAVSAAIDFGSSIFFPAGTYLVAGSGSIVKTGASNKTIYGENAVLKKSGTKGIFYFIGCSNIDIHSLEFDGDALADEAAAGSFLDGSRLSADYAYAVVFEECARCHVHDCYVHDFAWDGLVAYGIVAGDGLSATYSTYIRFTNNRLQNVRNTMIWNKAVQNLWVEGNFGFNDSSGSAFEQKGNFIFCVEFCEKVNIDKNQAFFIGDNFIGIGDQINDTAQAKNRQITVTNNLFKTCRFHGILVAQGKDCVIANNVIQEAGAKDAMFPSGAVLCSAITLISGVDGTRSSEPNERVVVKNNVIDNPYEIGIYAFDRGNTTIANGSTDLIFEGNIISNAGQLTLATRISSYGMLIQYPKPQVIRGNRVRNAAGEGIRIFGDAHLTQNTVTGCDSYGIHVPLDTVYSNADLSFPIESNLCSNNLRSGILVAGRTSPILNGNTCEDCGLDTTPGTEDVSTAYLYAGIGVYLADQVYLQGNKLDRNGSSGFVFRSGPSTANRVNAINNQASDNGATFTAANLRSGFYGEGNGTTSMNATFINSGGFPGTNQQYPIRMIFGGGSVSVDEKFTAHPNASTGVGVRDMSNIPVV